MDVKGEDVPHVSLSTERKDTPPSSLPPDIPKPRKRRESLKDQFLKLTGKTKIMDVLSEGLTSPIMSPSSTQPPPSIFERSEEKSEEVSSSPTPSNTSKKTSSSADVRNTLRGKIREQAQSLVDRTRGAAALTRRLERKATLTTHSTSPGDILSADETIEAALRKGEALSRKEEGDDKMLSEHMQTLFLTQSYPKETPSQENHMLCEMKGAVSAPPIDVSLLKFTKREERASDVELESSLFNVRRPIDWSLQSGRVEGRAGRWKRTQEHLKVERAENDHFVVYVHPESTTGLVNRLFEDIDIEIRAISFEHHWAFSREDMVAAKLRKVYEEQVETALAVIESVKGGARNGGEGITEAFEHHAKFISLGAKVKELASQLASTRQQQGYTSNTLSFFPGIEDRTPLSISSLGKLLSTTRNIQKATIEEKRRLDLLSKVKIQLVFHYNGIFALRTPSRSLAHLTQSTSHSYTLRVYSPPTSLTLSLVEKWRGREKVIAVIGLALPHKTSKMHFACPDPFPSVEGSVGAGEDELVKGYIDCGVEWKGEGKQIVDQENVHSDEPFSLFLPECELEGSSFEHNIPIIEETLGRDEPMSPIGMKLRIERERIVSRMTAVSLRKNLLERMTQRGATLEDIVKEEPIPTLAIAFGSLFGPADISRKLKPMRKDPLRTQAPPSASYRLILNIQSTRNLPSRTHSSSLRPFVFIRTTNGSYRTPSANGANANWQHTITVDMQGDRWDIGMIRIEVFDEVVQSLPQDDRLMNTRYEECTHMLLGWTEICPSTLVTRSKVDTYVRLQTPMFSSGYNMDASTPSLLKILLALEPATIIPPSSLLYRGLGESPELLLRCDQWSNSLSALFPDRQFVSTVSNSEGRALLSCRFLRPLVPPPPLDSLRSSPLAFCSLAVRLVSLLPHLPHDPSLVKLAHVWSSVDQLLSLECCSREEQGVLLSCWCLSLSIPVYLLLGRGDSEHSSMVLVQLEHTSLLLNPTDGSVLKLEDDWSPFCVHTIIHPTNIYANIQPFSHTSHINFDFTKKEDWRALLDKDTVFPSVQPDALQYTTMAEDSLVELRSSLERELKLRVDDSRQYGIPQWNLLVSRHLRESITSLESLKEVVNRQHQYSSISLLVLSIPFISINDCVERILSSQIHLSSHPQTQFALCVSLENPFNSVISATLALAVIRPTE